MFVFRFKSGNPYFCSETINILAMKLVSLPLLVVLLISAVGLPFTYVSYTVWGSTGQQSFFFGVSYGQNTTQGAKLLVDQVKDYTNFFLVNNWDLCTNETALDEVCNYAAQANLHFMVFFDFISNQTYLWHQTWLDTAKQRWGDKFLGIYLYDEPGGQQVDNGQWDNGTFVRELYSKVKSPSEAADAYRELGRTQSMNALKSRGIPVFTSDYALYWYDYEAGYDGVFVEYGWNVSRTQQTALCRGAADSFGRDWGAILTWTYDQPPYINSGTAFQQDMYTAYDAGAKYVVVFNYPVNPDGNPYGILTSEHFTAMRQFWNYTQNLHKGNEKMKAEAVLVLPKDYGGGLRKADDSVWAPLNVEPPYNVTWRQAWPADTQTPQIWMNLNKLSDRYGLKLDMVFDSENLSLMKRYSAVYLWSDKLS
jgi:hypothetical protein